MMTTTTPRLADLSRCFQGIVPSVIATSDSRGVPNVTYLSQVYLIDDRHVALSCQFFNKTRRNLDENPRARVEVYDPLTVQAYRLSLAFLRSETSGPLFDAMSMRIQAIASHTGMSGIFRLIAADVFEVRDVALVKGFLDETVPPAEGDELSREGLRSEMRGLQCISEHINRAETLEDLLASVLEGLESYFAFSHTAVLLHDESCGRLVTIASRGYGRSGVGAEVGVGDGFIGTVAHERRVLRVTGIDAGLRYGRAVRREAMTRSDGSVTPEIPLPGLTDAQSALVIPLAIGDRLVGILFAESRDPMQFGEWHEAYLEVIGNQIALGVDRMAKRDDETESTELSAERVLTPKAGRRVPLGIVYYRNDDCIFIDGEYLIRNVPAKILWKLLGEWRSSGRTEFTNREIRLDPALGLPPVKDNLESRLILLRQRLQEKCEGIRIVSTGRGRFSLRIEGPVEMTEK